MNLLRAASNCLLEALADSLERGNTAPLAQGFSTLQPCCTAHGSRLFGTFAGGEKTEDLLMLDLPLTNATNRPPLVSTALPASTISQQTPVPKVEDWTQLPRELDANLERLDVDAAVRPTKLVCGPQWTKQSQAGLLGSVSRVGLSTDGQILERLVPLVPKRATAQNASRRAAARDGIPVNTTAPSCCRDRSKHGASAGDAEQAGM